MMLLLLVALDKPRISWGQGDGFRQPVKVTQQDPSPAPANMSRSTGGQLVWTGEDRLGLIYWEGEDTISIASPSRIIYREWTPQVGWGVRQVVSHATSPGGTPMMARQPAMLLRPDQSLFAIWHDHRNCKDTPPVNLVNNIEIYGNSRPAGGTFAGTDIRLTETNTDSNGDNGYLPKLANLPGGRMVMVWYDFFWDVNISEIALKISDEKGSFGAADMSQVIRTLPGDRAAGDEGESFTTPSVAVDGDGIIHLVWATGITDSEGSNLYYGRFNPDTKQWLEKGRLHTGAGGQLDPAKLITDPASGDIWLVYTDYGTYQNNEIMIQRRARGATAFDAPIRITNDPQSQKYPDAAIDSHGLIHLAYVDQAPAATLVRYTSYDPATQVLQSPVDLTQGKGGAWARPAIQLDPSGYVYVVWENFEHFDNDMNLVPSELWFTTNMRYNAARGWGLYE